MLQIKQGVKPQRFPEPLPQRSEEALTTKDTKVHEAKATALVRKVRRVKRARFRQQVRSVRQLALDHYVIACVAHNDRVRVLSYELRARSQKLVMKPVSHLHAQLSRKCKVCSAE